MGELITKIYVYIIKYLYKNKIKQEPHDTGYFSKQW